ncbi:MAG TPA: transglycosylase domain-containing protein [Jatrophihabitans sp.]|nr:transglycosylase domain-containing protein [Jatrophihabitans sp.]
MKRFVAWNKHRRAVKKRRLAKMSRPKRVLRRVGIAGTWLLALITVGLLGFVALFYTLSNVPSPQSLPLAQTAVIEYSDGSTLAKIGTVNRTAVSLDQVPEQVRWDVVAAEDRNFFSEPGVSIKGTLRAVISDLTGGDTQGGSGITQQYVRNAYKNVGTQRTLTRKLKELMIAVKLNRKYSKDQILEFYLNTVYFGRGAYGIEAAAQAYFGKHVGALTVSQGAMLAGLLRAPSYYDPANNPDQAKLRWQYVLDGMVKTHHLTAQQEAQQVFPKTKPPKDTGLVVTGWKALLVQKVFAELQAHGISEDDVYQQGLVIRTTISKHAQNAALRAISDTFHDLTKKQRNLKNALVAVNPKNGAVLAYYGGTGPGVKGYDGQINYNDWAGGNGAAHPAGSAMKPYVLATALTQTINKEKNRPHLAIDSTVDGSFRRKIDGTVIRNDPSDASYSSPAIKLSLAMKYSLNTTFDWLAFKVGPENVAATAHAMGVAETLPDGSRSLQDKNGTTTFGIGIGDYSLTPLDQAAGYATLADGGVANDPYLVAEATTSQGDVVYRHHVDPQRAIDKRVANDVTLTLKPVAGFSGDGLDGGRESAAKTGTAGVSPTSTANSDAWMVGFTPQVSAAVWVGTGMRKPIYDSAGNPLYGRELPGQTWKRFMDDYLTNKPELPLPDRQLIAANGGTPVPSHSASAPPTSAPPTTSSAPATHSAPPTAPSSPSAPPSTSAPPSSPPPTSPSTSGSASCGLLKQCHSGGGSG